MLSNSSKVVVDKHRASSVEQPSLQVDISDTFARANFEGVSNGSLSVKRLGAARTGGQDAARFDGGAASRSSRNVRRSASTQSTPSNRIGPNIPPRSLEPLEPKWATG